MKVHHRFSFDQFPHYINHDVDIFRHVRLVVSPFPIFLEDDNHLRERRSCVFDTHWHPFEMFLTLRDKIRCFLFRCQIHSHLPIAAVEICGGVELSRLHFQYHVVTSSCDGKREQSSYCIQLPVAKKHTNETHMPTNVRGPDLVLPPRHKELPMDRNRLP